MSSRLLGLSLGIAMIATPIVPAFAQWSPAFVNSRTEAAKIGFGGPVAAQEAGSDIRSLADRLEDEVTGDRDLTFEALTQRYPEEVVVGALARMVSTGSVQTRSRAAHVLAQAPGPIPVLILLDNLRRVKAKSVQTSICKELAKYGGTGLDSPISEGKFLLMLEKIGEENRTDAGQFLVPLLNTWPGFRVPIVRALARINHRPAITAFQSMLGGSDEIDAEVIGALALMGVDRDANRERLARALPRACELGQKGLGAFQSICFYLQHMAIKYRDPLAVKPLLYIPPHAQEPMRTQSMAVIHKIAAADPAVFVTGIAQVSHTDRREIIKDFVAYCYQKDFDQDLMATFHRAFRDLDLEFPHHDIAQAVMYEAHHHIPLPVAQ